MTAFGTRFNQFLDSVRQSFYSNVDVQYGITRDSSFDTGVITKTDHDLADEFTLIDGTSAWDGPDLTFGPALDNTNRNVDGWGIMIYRDGDWREGFFFHFEEGGSTITVPVGENIVIASAKLDYTE